MFAKIFEYECRHKWVDLKAELASTFAAITDSQHPFILLRKLKQAREERMQMFAERLLTLAEEAYRDQPGRFEAIERQLVRFFIDELIHDYLKMKRTSLCCVSTKSLKVAKCHQKP